MEAEQAMQREARNSRPLEHGMMMPESFKDQARERDSTAIETIVARGKFDATTGKFRDFLPHELPE